MKRRRSFIIGLGLLVALLALAVVVAGSEERYDFGGRTITYSAWWELRPEPGASVDADREIRRVAEVEKKYNVKIDYANIPWGEYLARYITTVMAGDSMADIVSVEVNWFYPTLLLNNFCLSLSSLDVFDFNAEKFQRETVEFGEYNGEVYCYEVDNIYPRGILYFNKTMFEREGITDMYDVLFNYEWTWDKMLEYCKRLTRDTDGDGIIDQWGLGGGTGRVWRGFVISNNAHFIDVSDKSNPRFALGDPNAIEALQAYQDFILKDQVVLIPPEGSPWDYAVEAFIEGKLGILVAQVYKLHKMKENMQDEYGLVLFPMGPKMNEYTSELTGHFVKVMPITVKNPKEVAIVEDAMTEPHPDEHPDDWREYYEMRVTDEESIDTVKLIWDKQLSVFNFQSAFGIMDIFYTLEWDIQTGNSTPQAAVEEFAQEAQMRITDSLIL